MANTLINIALIQLTSGADVHANIRRVTALVAQAAKKKADLVALPENVFEMQEPGKPRLLATQAKHPGVRTVTALARKHKVWLLAGSMAVLPKAGDKKTYNRSLLISPQGKITATYDKIHLFDVEVGDGQLYLESAKIIPGKKAVVARTPWGKLGMTVCYDVRFPHLYRQLAQKGADILAVPSAFTKVTGEAHWHVLLRARAIENGCFVIAPAQTGTHPGNRKTFGHSLVIDPWGKVLADGGTKEGVVMAKIDMSEVAKRRKMIPSLKHDRTFT